MANPQMYANENGEIRWQPQLENGDCQWRRGSYKVWSYSFIVSRRLRQTPVLYRSKARAVRVAARKERALRAEFEKEER